MLAAAIAPPVAFSLYLVAMFSLLWWHRRRQQSRMRSSGDHDGDGVSGDGDVESKQHQQHHHQHRPSRLEFASSVLDVPLSPSVDSSTPLAPPRTRGYSGVLAISPVTPAFSPTSTVTAVGSPLNPQRLAPRDPSPKSSVSRNSRFRISVPAFVGRRLSGSPNGNNPAGPIGGGSGSGSGGVFGGGSEGGGGGSAYRHGRRRSRADPVLPRTSAPAAPTLRFNSNDMLASRRPRVPSIRQHILNSPNHSSSPRTAPPAPSAATAALLANSSRTPPPPTSPLPLPPAPLPSPSSPMPVMPALCMLSRPRFTTGASSSKTKDKTRVRPLPPLPLHELSSPSSRPQQQQQQQGSLQSPQTLVPSPRSATTPMTAASPLSAQPVVVLQPNRLYLPEKEQQPPPSSSSRQYPFSRLVGQRRQRARDPDSPPPYTSQYLDKP